MVTKNVTVGAKVGFGHEHYVPVMKSKAGEIWALGNISPAAKSVVTPLVEVLGHKTRGLEDHARGLAHDLARAWGTTDPLFVDPCHLGAQAGAGAEAIFGALRAAGCPAIPVTSLGRSPAYQQATQRAVAADKRGVMVRLEARDFVDLARLEAALRSLGTVLSARPPEIDILIDYGVRSQSAEIVQFARLHMPGVPNLHQWRTVTIAAGSFPASLLNYSQDQWHPLPREEWAAWVTVQTTNPPLPRRPAYSDYGVRDPSAPAPFGTPSANLRYTSTQVYLARRGTLVKNGGAQQMPAMCRSLIGRPEFCGSQFSAGDREIARIAASSDSSGNAQQWIQWCMSHHIEFVADQIRNHHGL